MSLDGAIPIALLTYLVYRSLMVKYHDDLELIADDVFSNTATDTVTETVTATVTDTVTQSASFLRKVLFRLKKIVSRLFLLRSAPFIVKRALFLT